MRPEQWYRSTWPEGFTDDHFKDFSEYAIKQFPNEACAFLIDGKIVPVVNQSQNPTEQFELSTQDTALQLKATAFLHTHPNGSVSPSSIDMVSQKSSNLPFGICTTTADSCSLPIFFSDANLALPLLERPFIHGIFDCYASVRGWYFQKRNVKLPDFARDDKWWEQPPENFPDLYLRNFEKANFSAIPKTEPMQEGDVILMNIMSGNIVSHAAVYLGNGLIYHHLHGRVSREEHAPTWKKFFHTIVRYNG